MQVRHFRRRANRQREDEGGAADRRFRRLDRATVGFHNGAANGQPQADAGLGRFALAACEFFENRFFAAAPHAGAVIVHHHAPEFAALHGMDDDVTFRTSAAQSDLVMPASEPVPLADSHSEALAVAEPIRIVPADAASSEDRDESAYPWSSAQKAREWFEGLREQQRPALTKLEDFWQTQKANIWLGASAIILLFAIIQFFAAPVTPSAKADNSDKVAAPQLTFFEGLLVSLGLAEAPPAISSYTGNPEARVWVDTRTALYYCEGTGQYGKTPAGKFTSQRDAQQDQFEPAHRKVCP